MKPEKIEELNHILQSLCNAANCHELNNLRYNLLAYVDFDEDQDENFKRLLKRIYYAIAKYSQQKNTQ